MVDPRTRKKEQKRKNVRRDEKGYAICQQARDTSVFLKYCYTYQVHRFKVRTSCTFVRD